MRVKTFIFLFISVGSVVLSCKNKIHNKYKAGVVLSFDDVYVNEWCEADVLLKKYKWKATFCVCKIDSLQPPEIKKLHVLQSEGHEIAGHGYHHYNATNFVEKNGIDEYVTQEINPMIASMKKNSFNSTSFSYPFGARSALLDKTLALKFDIIRGRAFCGYKPEKEGCFYNNSKFVYAFDIDNNHIHFSMSYLLELLNYAKKNNKILILCSHKPVQKAIANYQTTLKTLEFVCKFVKQNNMKYYRLSDLKNLKL